MDTNAERPFLGRGLPTYPPLSELVRVTSSLTPGPSPGQMLYMSILQQLRPDSLTPRDRIPCLVVDVAKLGLTPGFYPARLVSNFNNTPVYEVVGFATQFPGLGSDQLGLLTGSLTASQISTLDNLNACQLNVLTQLPIENINRLTFSLSPNQITNIVDTLNINQLIIPITQLPFNQIRILADVFPQLYQTINFYLTPTQIISLFQNLNLQQINALIGLTPQQLQIVGQLTPTQLQKLTGVPSSQIPTVVDTLTLPQLQDKLNTLTIPQLISLTGVFGAAGSLHVQGLVPDPGSVVNSPPFFLGDDAAWHQITANNGVGQSYAGGVLAFSSNDLVGRLTSDDSSIAQALTTIGNIPSGNTNFKIGPLTTNEIRTFVANIILDGSTNGGNGFQVQVTTQAGNVSLCAFQVEGTTTAVGTTSTETINGAGNLSAAYCKNFKGYIKLWGIIKAGAGGCTVTIDGKTPTGNNSIPKAGSWMRASFAP